MIWDLILNAIGFGLQISRRESVMHGIITCIVCCLVRYSSRLKIDLLCLVQISVCAYIDTTHSIARVTWSLDYSGVSLKRAVAVAAPQDPGGRDRDDGAGRGHGGSGVDPAAAPRGSQRQV